MEFAIDDAAVRRMIEQEYRQATDDVTALGAVAALKRSQQRHDASLAAAADAGTLACKAGCYWCCYFSVDVRAIEVLRILEVMEHGMPAAERERIHDEIAANSAVLRQFDEEQRSRSNIKCPFLAGGCCTIYDARPQTCRNYHATDVAGCKLSFEQPDNLDIDPEFAPLVYQAGGAHVDAFSKAMHDAGYDTQAYELNSALAEALTDPEAFRRRFVAREPAFTSISGTRVPLEFMEE